MATIDGIGGFFFRASDPEALAKWYEQHFGINPVPTSYEMEPWSQKAGYTVFAPFPADTDYFGEGDKQFMLNFRVADLDAAVTELRDAGVDVGEHADHPNGRFARLADPEGNPIELWQPSSP